MRYLHAAAAAAGYCYGFVSVSAQKEIIVLTTLRKLGNSHRVIIPKPLLAQVGLTNEAEIDVENGAILLRPIRRTLRSGWAEASRAVAADDESELAWPEFANESDDALRWC